MADWPGWCSRPKGNEIAEDACVWRGLIDSGEVGGHLRQECFTSGVTIEMAGVVVAQ